MAYGHVVLWAGASVTARCPRHAPKTGDRRRCLTTGKIYTYDGWYSSHPLDVWARTGLYASRDWEWAALGCPFPSENPTNHPTVPHVP